MKRVLLFVVFRFVAAAAMVGFASTSYVNPGDKIQDAINLAVDGDIIIVRDGIYTGEGNRDIDFHGKAITLRSENGPESTIIDCGGMALGFWFVSGEGVDSVVDGLTIRNGEAGIYCEWNSNPTIANCIIGGGLCPGIFCYQSSPAIVSCTIVANFSSGIACSHSSSPAITDCIISDNSAGGGGGVYCRDFSSPTITGCTISDNLATRGGGIGCYGGSSPTIANSTITGNAATRGGGGIYCNQSNANITNCTITGNGTDALGGGIYFINGSPTITNSILWNDSPEEIYVESGTPILQYCDIKGGWPGAGSNNIDADPLLTQDGHLRLGSPCIDRCPSGTANDIDGETRPFPTAGGYDIGADEFVDTDVDGLPDWLEIRLAGSATGASPAGDDDADTLTNIWEYENGTDPGNADTDGDGQADDVEIADGTNLLHPDNPERTYYVNGATGHDSYDGLASSWDGTHGPKATIQAGIDVTITRWDYTVQVADGIYTGPRNTDLGFRRRAITLQSENGADVTVIDCENVALGFCFDAGEDADTIVDGFTIRNGIEGIACSNNSNPEITNCIIANSLFRGIYCDESSPVISNCTVRANFRGGILCKYSDGPTITNCIISDNSSYGVSCYESSPTITDCTISRNSCRMGEGGGVYLGRSNNSTIANCTISGNSANYGGGIFCRGSTGLEITNCTIFGNFASWNGGGVYCSYSSPRIVNCTITDNMAGRHGSGIYLSMSGPRIMNSILWNAGPEEIYAESWVPVLEYCDIRGGWSGAGGNNIDADPLLTQDGHLRLGSPCIDRCPSGTASDMDGETRPFPMAGSYDIGADEFIDTDGDGLPDWLEIRLAGSATGASPAGDDDADTLTNLWEYENGTDPENADTDGDGRDDDVEIADETNLLHPDNLEKTYYINGATGDDAHDGLSPSWDGTHGPKATIQAGIDATMTAWDYIVQVADGIYTGPHNRDLRFRRKAITLQSENGADVTVIDCENTDRGFYLNVGEDADTALDGFTVRNGVVGIACSNNSAPKIVNCIVTENFVGIYCDGSSPVISNCIVSRNLTRGIRCERFSSPTITNCIISDNFSTGIYCDESSPIITDCMVFGNSWPKGEAGGGVRCGHSSNPTIANCTISGNFAGGLACYDSSNPTIVNCRISGNSAGWGGGISCGWGSRPRIVNCTISGNSADYGGGIYDGSTGLQMTNCTVTDNMAAIYGGGIYGCSNSSTIANCILWNDTPEEIYVFSGWPTLSYCDIQGGWPGTGNIDVDPMFVDPEGGNYHLLWDSPCIDAGDNSVPNLPAEDLDGYPRIQFGKTSLTVDMGAYEFGKYFTFTDISVIGDSAPWRAEIQLTWSSNGLPGTLYDLYFSSYDFSDSMRWWRAESDIPTGGSLTSWTDTSYPDNRPRFYRVVDKGTDLYSHDTVGFVWKSLGNGRNLVSMPFILFDTLLDSVIGDQLTGDPHNKFFSDTIEHWDPVALNYSRVWYNTKMWVDWEDGGLPWFDFEPDAGYRVNIMPFNPSRDICFLGKVAQEGRSIEISQGRNLCGSSYPVEISLDTSDLIDSGFTGSSSRYFSDTVEWWNPAILHYDRVWYDTSSGEWKNWDGVPATRGFVPGDGFWVNVLTFNTPFTWIYPKPYSQPPNN